MSNEKSKEIVELAINDKANEMRDAFYAAIQGKLADALESRKMEIAASLVGQPSDQASDSE